MDPTKCEGRAKIPSPQGLKYQRGPSEREQGSCQPAFPASLGPRGDQPLPGCDDNDNPAQQVVVARATVGQLHVRQVLAMGSVTKRVVGGGREGLLVAGPASGGRQAALPE